MDIIFVRLSGLIIILFIILFWLFMSETHTMLKWFTHCFAYIHWSASGDRLTNYQGFALTVKELTIQSKGKMKNMVMSRKNHKKNLFVEELKSKSSNRSSKLSRNSIFIFKEFWTKSWSPDLTLLQWNFLNWKLWLIWFLHQKHHRFKKLIERALPNHIKDDFVDLFQNHINILFDKICVQQSHVLLTFPEVMQILKNLNQVKYKEMTHISSETYYDKFHGYVYRNDMNSFVAETFKRM